MTEDYDLQIAELYQSQHECYMTAMALNNVVELIPVYKHTLQPSGEGEALLIQQVTDALVRASITPSYEGLLESAWNFVVKFIRKLGEYLKRICDWITERVKRWFSKSKVDRLTDNLAYIEKHRDVYNKCMNQSEFGKEALNFRYLTQLRLTITPSMNPTAMMPNHPTFNSLSGRLTCVNAVLQTTNQDVLSVLNRVQTYAVVDVVDVFQNMYSCDVRQKERAFQNIIDQLVVGLVHLNTRVDSLNNHCLEYTSIGNGWDTVDLVRTVINSYHTTASSLNNLNDGLRRAASGLSTKSFDSIRIDTHGHTLGPQQRIVFQTFVADYSNACRAIMSVIIQIHRMLMAVSGDMTAVFNTVEMARTRLETGIARARRNGNTRSGTTVTVLSQH